MPTRKLSTALDELASRFAGAILDAVRTASLDELLAGGVAPAARTARRRPERQESTSQPSARRSPRSTSAPVGRPARRSSATIARAIERVVSLVKKHKDGLRSEQIRAELAMRANEMPRVLRAALAQKALKAKGQRRGTRYFAT
jgi:hypothetical protein